MNRTTPMRRTGFARSTPKPAKVYETHVARPRPVALRVPDTRARLTVPVPKLDTVRSKPLLEACRRLACQHCGANDGTVVAAHSNWSTHGKGKALKVFTPRLLLMQLACLFTRCVLSLAILMSLHTAVVLGPLVARV